MKKIIIFSLLLIFPQIKARVKFEAKLRVLPTQRFKLLAKLAPYKTDEKNIVIQVIDEVESPLNQQGIYLRLRKYFDGSFDTSIKLRPFDLSKIPAEWFNRPGFKCETNITINNEIASCSLKAKFNKHVSYDNLMENFSPLQQKFLSSFKNLNMDMLDLRASKEVQAYKTIYNHPDFTKELEVESWIMPSGKKYLEISTKTNSQGLEVFQKLLDLIESQNITIVKNPESRLRNLL